MYGYELIRELGKRFSTKETGAAFSTIHAAAEISMFILNFIKGHK